ncbi:hypothetical protein Cadr_000030827 [Camelus dromedarius]|uniref:Uncharacterized protein n=1 Tax=Camelus dromedarius TaxID=9838 RepID=A0A5N4BZA9_CAMDR|nr:hypothetical protein Cadr_000030827 [Camelus dromedarius]
MKRKGHRPRGQDGEPAGIPPTLRKASTAQLEARGRKEASSQLKAPGTPATRTLREQLLTLDHTDLVILENAAFPPRESQKSLNGKVGDRKGGSRSNEMQTRTQGLARLFPDLAKAAVMGKKSVALQEEATLPETGLTPGPRGRGSVGLGSSPSSPGVWCVRSHSCPDATLGLFSGRTDSNPARRLQDTTKQATALACHELGVCSLHRPCPTSQPQGALEPCWVCTGTTSAMTISTPWPGAASQPQACMHHADHRSQLAGLSRPTPDPPTLAPAPLGPLVETGAPCSKAVLLRGVIKRQEDIGAQTLMEEALALKVPEGFFPLHPPIPPRSAAQDKGGSELCPRGVPPPLAPTHHSAPAMDSQQQSRSWSEQGMWPPMAHLGDIRDKILPEGQAAPNEPHSYDMMGQAHDVLVEPAMRRKGKGRDRIWELRSQVLRPQAGSRAWRPAWLSTPRGLASGKQRPQAGLDYNHNQEGQGLTGMHSQHLLGGVGIRQGDGKHARILLCCKVPVEVRQPGQSCDTRDSQPMAMAGAGVTGVPCCVSKSQHSHSDPQGCQRSEGRSPPLPLDLGSPFPGPEGLLRTRHTLGFWEGRGNHSLRGDFPQNPSRRGSESQAEQRDRGHRRFLEKPASDSKARKESTQSTGAGGRKALRQQRVVCPRCPMWHSVLTCSQRELHNQDRQRLDDDVRHFHAADGQGHHTLAGAAVDEALLQAVHHLPLTLCPCPCPWRAILVSQGFQHRHQQLTPPELTGQQGCSHQVLPDTSPKANTGRPGHAGSIILLVLGSPNDWPYCKRRLWLTWQSHQSSMKTAQQETCASSGHSLRANHPVAYSPSDDSDFLQPVPPLRNTLGLEGSWGTFSPVWPATHIEHSQRNWSSHSPQELGWGVSMSSWQCYDQEHRLRGWAGLSLNLGPSPCCGLEWKLGVLGPATLPLKTGPALPIQMPMVPGWARRQGCSVHTGKQNQPPSP